jgi:hypothetical protein
MKEVITLVRAEVTFMKVAERVLDRYIDPSLSLKNRKEALP